MRDLTVLPKGHLHLHLDGAMRPASLAELAERYPAMDWPAYLADLGVSGVETVIVTQEGYLEALPAIMAETPPAALRA